MWPMGTQLAIPWFGLLCHVIQCWVLSGTLILYSHANTGRIRFHAPGPRCSCRALASPKSCLGIASLESFTQRNQENSYQYNCQHSLWIYFLNCGKIFYLWLVTADVIKNDQCNIFLHRQLWVIFQGDMVLVTWGGQAGSHFTHRFLCTMTRLRLLGLCV